jgi:signal transduction histidine kinase
MAAVRRIALELRLPPDLCVQGDMRRAKQVLLDLAGNANKYRREGSHVTLSAGSHTSTGPWAAVRDPPG